MNAFQRKIKLRVVGVHAAIIFLMIVIPAIKGCFKPRPKEIVTFIEFGAAPATVNLQPVAKMAEPEAPAPEPDPTPIPEPVKPRPKPVEKPMPKEPEKPKWKPVKASDIKIGKKVKSSSPAPPSISSSEIRKALSGIVSSSASPGSPSRFNDYYARVMAIFYQRWTPPASATSATGSAVVRISMRKNGQITKRAKIKSSGDPLYDRTVMDAVNAVSTMPLPPDDYPYDYVEVIFTLDG
jgi:TonB family protein